MCAAISRGLAAFAWQVVPIVKLGDAPMKAKHGMPKERIASGKTQDGHDYFINEYPATKNYSQWERAGNYQPTKARKETALVFWVSSSLLRGCI